MNQDEILSQLARIGAIIRNSHLVYTSGKHGSAYVNKDAIYPHTQLTSSLCKEIAGHFAKMQVDAVVGPVLGGIVLSQWVAHHLSIETDRTVFGVYAEKDDSDAGFVIKRGYDKLIESKKVLIVEDILTTGGSVRKVVDVVRACGAQVVGVGALCNRGKISAQDLGQVPELFSLVEVQLETWDENQCPLCTKQVPINLDVGKGREFLAKRAATQK